jgi:glycosyltransferase involved in cell wall biosynthesis
MHIGYLSPSWPPSESANGIVTYVSQMNRGMSAQGHSVTIFSPIPGQGAVHVQHAGAPARLGLRARVQRRIQSISGSFEFFAVDLADTIEAVHRRTPIDVFEMEESFGLAGHLCQRLPFPVIVRLHTPHFLGLVEKNTGMNAFRDRVRIRREGMAIRRARAITTMSPSMLEETFRHYAFRHDNAHIIYNPIDAMPVDRKWRLEESDPNLLLFVGRFDARKGGDIVLKAFSILAQKNRDLRLVFAGTDPGILMPDGSKIHLRQYIASQIPEAVRGKIEYVGRQAEPELQALRRRARAVIVASRFESSCYALFEVMAIGAPAVTSSHYGAQDHVETGKNGIVVPIADAAATADALEAVLGNPDLAARIGHGGWQLCCERFSLETVCRKSEALYRSLA